MPLSFEPPLLRGSGSGSAESPTQPPPPRSPPSNQRSSLWLLEALLDSVLLLEWLEYWVSPWWGQKRTIQAWKWTSNRLNNPMTILTFECLIGDSFPGTSCLGILLCPPPPTGPLDDETGTCQRGSRQKTDTRRIKANNNLFHEGGWVPVTTFDTFEHWPPPTQKYTICHLWITPEISIGPGMWRFDQNSPLYAEKNWLQWCRKGGYLFCSAPWCCPDWWSLRKIHHWRSCPHQDGVHLAAGGADLFHTFTSRSQGKKYICLVHIHANVIFV